MFDLSLFPMGSDGYLLDPDFDVGYLYTDLDVGYLYELYRF